MSAPEPSAFESYRREVAQEQEEILGRGADARVETLRRHGYYYGILRDLLRDIVEPDRDVLCLRSDVGQYLDWVRPRRGVGIEISPELTDIAKQQRPGFEFLTGDVENPEVDGTFDYILIVDAVNELFDVQGTLENLRPNCRPDTRIVIVFYNFLWQPLAELAERLGMKREQPKQSWLSFQHLAQLAQLAGYEPVRRYRKTLWPFPTPLVGTLLNGGIAKLPLFERLCLTQALVLRPTPEPAQRAEDVTVSVVIPCKDEFGNIEAAVRRTPQMGAHTELVFCDDRSTDGTADEVRRLQRENPDRNIRLVEGPGICKAENVWAGFDAAEGDILMILDGDLAVPPEELPKFYQALVDGRGEFINGTRMVYPMRNQAMRLLNVFGNKLFSMLFGFVLGQDISDTLCGTKAVWRRDYERMRPLRGSWGTNDRWGDYELIFGAARLGLRHLDLPVHYMERTYGDTKMNKRLGNARVMLRMSLEAYRRLH
ncbi:MAG: bifunctional class I SAM-dependent methyltransferase/glycosyltransferase family 2 protein [Candidatus Binatia bacterium]|nr:bifunctional class I SAM-dependent methyltransferase/glycosyltransferase family 2 protein [Candidatus Binatia bacterium]